MTEPDIRWARINACKHGLMIKFESYKSYEEVKKYISPKLALLFNTETYVLHLFSNDLEQLMMLKLKIKQPAHFVEYDIEN